MLECLYAPSRARAVLEVSIPMTAAVYTMGLHDRCARW